MNENDLKTILARNPQVTARDNSTLCPILAQEPQPRAASSSDGHCSGKEQSQTRAFILFVFRRTRLLDVDAVAGSGKDLLDGLQDAGFISGDSETEICFEALQQKVAKRKDEGTYIFIATGTEAEQLTTAQRKWRGFLLTRLFSGEKL